MNYNKLKYFYEVSKTLNLTKTSQDFFISQPALSKHIADLEEDLKVALFVRTNRNLILTKAGEVLAKECEPFFSKEAELYRKVLEASSEDKSILVISFMGLGDLRRIKEIIHQFKELYPHVDVQMQRQDWNKIQAGVNANETDIGVKLFVQESYPDDFEVCRLRSGQLMLIVPSDHRFAGLKSASIRQLKDEGLIILAPKGAHISHEQEHTFELCRREGFTPKIAATYPYVETVVTMVQAGVGIALLSSFAPLMDLDGIKCIPVENVPPIHMDLIWHKKNDNPALLPFVELMKSHFFNY